MSKDTKTHSKELLFGGSMVLLAFVFDLLDIFFIIMCVPLILIGLATIARFAFSFFFGGPLPKTVQDALGRRE